MMIDPPSLNSGRAFCTVKSVPRTLTPKVLSNCSSVTSPMGANSPVPALAKRTSIRPFLLLHRLVQAIEVGEVAGVALDAGDVPADRLHRVVQLLLAAAGDEDVGPFLDEELGRGQGHARSRPRPHRCTWAEADPLLRAYHDEEWGVPERDSRALWEKLMLDGFQAGLSWLTILRKREAFRQAFKGFDPEIVARFGEADVKRLLENTGIVRSRAKIEATIRGARAYLAMQAPAKIFQPSSGQWRAASRSSTRLASFPRKRRCQKQCRRPSRNADSSLSAL